MDSREVQRGNYCDSKRGSADLQASCRVSGRMDMDPLHLMSFLSLHVTGDHEISRHPARDAETGFQVYYLTMDPSLMTLRLLPNSERSRLQGGEGDRQNAREFWTAVGRER
jgi:hypothetical protein